MRALIQKPKATQQTTSTKSTRPSRAYFGQSFEVNSILHLQRAVGNQAVLQMLQSEAEKRESDFTLTASRHFGHSRVPMQPPAAGPIQTKLAIDKPGDEYEQEADRVAEQVVQQSGADAIRVGSRNEIGGLSP